LTVRSSGAGAGEDATSSPLRPALPTSSSRRLPDADAQDKPPHTSSHVMHARHMSVRDTDKNNTPHAITNVSSRHQVGEIPTTQLDVQDGDLASRGRQRERTPHVGRRHGASYSDIEGISIFIYLFVDILIYVIDVTMHSPPKDSIPAYGSSRSTQGVFRGRASGNTFNMGDVEAVWDDINKYNDHPDGEPKKGKIHLFISELNPSVIDIDHSAFVATVYDTAKCQTVQDVMKLGSRNYSPIRSKLFVFLFF
jgi:hypothetical protein